MNKLFLLPTNIDFYFYLFLVTKSVHWNCMGLYLVGGGLFVGISEFCLFTRVCSMSENMVGSRNNICVGTTGQFWILAFLEVLKMKFYDFRKSVCVCVCVWGGGGGGGGTWPLWPLPLHTVFLFYLYSCANIITKFKSKSNGNYTKLTNKQKNYCK